jgi:hypothetical protein
MSVDYFDLVCILWVLDYCCVMPVSYFLISSQLSLDLLSNISYLDLSFVFIFNVGCVDSIE